MTPAELRTDTVIVAAAVSAGIHAALVREHWQEHVAAGIAFLVATVVLAALAVALTLRPENERLRALAALVFAGLIASYVFAVTTGVPILHPDVDAVGGLALATKAIEAVGLVAATTFTRIERNPKWTPLVPPARFRSR